MRNSFLVEHAIDILQNFCALEKIVGRGGCGCSRGRGALEGREVSEGIQIFISNV